VNNVRTVSDTKRAFYNTHTRPINSIYRRVVEEMMVEMHLLSVNTDFRYDPIYGLGVVTAFDRFMNGYLPDRDKASIFNALCQSMGEDPQLYQQDAELLRTEVTHSALSALITQIQQPPDSNTHSLVAALKGIAENPKFKYSRLSAIGLYSLLEYMDAELVKDEQQRTDALNQLSEALHLPQDKIQKDLELYRSNLEKMAQAQIVLQDILKADRKKKEDRAKAKDAVTTPPSEPAEPS
jgi:photosystem II biogenesis protein Psp29